MLVSPNLDPNKHWILVENKVLIKSKQALGCSWCKRNKVYKFDSDAVVRREEEKKILQV
jgi:hypothetical protein